MFQVQESIIKDITLNLNAAKRVIDKSVFCKELLEEVSVLLACQDYEDSNADCKNCRFISNLRKKTTEIIIMSISFAMD